MTIMIASDIHGSAYWCREMLCAWKRERPDKLLLLGDILYHGPRNELPEGYVLAGSLVFAENPKRSGADLSSDWTLEAELYFDPDNDRVVYITAYKGYLKARKK